MADVRPFRGFRFAPARVPLSRALCPPYDVIDPDQAARLREDASNAVHLELPAGEGEQKYAAAAALWRRWRDEGVVERDAEPDLYVVEERFKLGGKAYRRVGFLSALGVTDEGAADVVAHERTLPKPKADRLRLLETVQANISPIFGLFADPTGIARRTLAKALKGKPAASGTMKSGVKYRLWTLSDRAAVAAISKALKGKKVLIADGHHRFEVSRAHWKQSPGAGRETVLAYLCPEEDAGLVVLSTHRVTERDGLAERTRELCRVTPCRTRAELIGRLEREKNPYAYGLYLDRFELAVPRSRDGCRSGLCVEWLGKRLLAEVAPDRIKYTPDAPKAERMARESGAAVVFVKPLEVPQIRKAVRAVGLLPPKSTYFYPKIATGLVFKSLE
jgi:uncharacterized protein (DUF1015 family)